MTMKKIVKDYKRDYSEFGGSFYEYRKMVWKTRIFLVMFLVSIVFVIWVFLSEMASMG